MTEQEQIKGGIQRLYDELRAAETFREFDNIVKQIKLLRLEEKSLRQEADKMSDSTLTERQKAEHNSDKVIIEFYNKLKKSGLPTRALVVQTAKAYANAVLITYQKYNGQK